MTIFEAIIQGVVQGLTEFLPVSSSGHLTITQHVLGINLEGNNLFLNVMLHIGTLVAVVAFYHKLIWRLIKAFFSMIGDIFTGKFKWKELSDDKRMVIMVIIGLLPLALLFIPVPGTDMKLKDLVESFNTERYFIVVGICLLLTSALLLIGSLCSRTAKPMKHASGGVEGRTSLNVLDAIAVGITQCFATLPGLSRSGSTLSVGQMRGLNKQTALDYTFILGTPAIIAAALLEGKDALEGGTEQITADIVPIIIGMVVAAVVGYLAIALFKWLLKTDKMIVFIIYTAVVGIAVIVISIMEMQSGVNLFTGAPIT